MSLQLRLVRFCCDNTACRRQTFAESIPALAMRYSRRTNRATELLTHIAFELGGQAGQRVAEKCRLRISRSTMLRLVRRSQLPEFSSVKVLGIDDWAFCRGTRYGTILVDLERKKVVELLPEVNADMVSAWLQAQPTMEVISRDRSYVFAKAAQKGAPLAQQVVDRWHLMHNLWDVLVLIFGQHLKDLKQVNLPPSPSTLQDTAAQQSLPRKRPPSPIEQARAERRQYWEMKFTQVHQLLHEGLSKYKIAQQLGISERVVRKYSHMDHLPKKQSPKSSPRLIDPYRHLLRQYLTEEKDPPTLASLHRRLQTLGFNGSRTTVYKAVLELRDELRLPVPTKTSRVKPTPIHPHQLATWTLSSELSIPLQQVIQEVCELHPTLEMAIGLARDFVSFLRNHQPHHLIHWIDAVMLTDIRSLKTFANGLLKDLDAVLAACTSPWSNAQVEGQVNRLKLIKRQMYGRANFDLLRLRVLYNGVLTT